MTELEHLVRGRLLARSGEGRRLRRAAGLTVRELAAYVGVDGSTLHRWENGQFGPRGLTAVRYEQALDVLAELLRRDGGAEFDEGSS